MRFIPLEESDKAAQPLTFVPLEAEATKPAPKAEAKPETKPEVKPAATTAPKPDVNIDPTTGKPYPELRALPEPSVWDKLWAFATRNETIDNKAKAANEYAARRYAAENKVPLSTAYKVTKDAHRPVFNPEGRESSQAAVQSAAAVVKSLPDMPEAALNTTLRAIRGGDVPVKDRTWLDRSITATTQAPRKGDPNVTAFANVGQSLGYSVTTMVSAAISNAIAGPYAAGAVGVTVPYRASKDEFLSRLRENLDDNAKKIYGKPLSDKDWGKAREEFEDAATRYAAWESVPEALSNLIMLKAFTAPLRTVNSADRIAEIARRGVISQVAEQGTETITALGQNKEELRAGLTKEELSVADAFRQQFVQTLITTGALAGGAKGVQQVNKFYETYVEPKVRPGSALARAIHADLNTYLEQQQTAAQPYRFVPLAPIATPAAPEPVRPELKDLQAARKPELETEETTPDRTLSALEQARNEGIEVEAPEGPTLSAMERARKPELEGEPITPPREEMIQARAVEYERQGYMEDDARLLAERDVAAEMRRDVGGRAVQRQDIEDERRTAEGRAERAAMSMEAPSELPEPPSYVTEPSTGEYGAAVPSGAAGTTRGPTSAFDRGLDTARNITGKLDARERAERASLDANKRRIESSISAAFSREAMPDLGLMLGASWTRNTLAANPTPEEYQEAAYARLEELDGQRPSDAAPVFERGEAPAAAEEKPAAAPPEEKVTTEAKTEAPAAPSIRLRRPTEREKSIDSASAVIDFGAEGKAVIAEGLGDVYLQDAQGNELAVRQWDSRPGNIKDASQFPSFVPESLRQPIIDYQDAAYRSNSGTPESRANLNAARDRLQDAVAEIIKPAAAPAKAEPVEATPVAEVAPEIKAAQELLFAIDEGGVPLNPAKLNNIARNIGLDVNKSARPEETIQRIRAAVGRAAPTKPTEFAPLELEAGRREDLEVEPAEIKAVEQAEQALTKAGTPRQRAPGAGRPKSETAKTPAERVAQSNALNKFNRDVALLIDKAKEFSQRQSIETFETPEEFEYKEAVRDMRADQMRTAIYGISQRSGMAQGYIDAKDYIRSLPEALRGRAKALYEGRVKLEDYHEIPPKPETLIEKERKSEAYKKAREEGKAKKEAERSAIDKGLAARRREQEASGLTNDEIYRIEQQLDMRPDPTFKELTTLTGALVYISESPNQLEAELAARLLQDDNIDSIEGTSLQVVETDTTDVDPAAKEMLDDDAVGTYVAYTQGGGVFLRGESYGKDQGINNEIVLHEAMHASGAKKIAFVELAEKNDTPVPARLAEAVHQLRDLMDRARDSYAKLIAAGTAPSSLDRLADAGAFTNIQEFYAYGMTDPDMKLFLRDTVPGTSTKTSGFDRFVDILMRLFGINPELKSGLKDLLLVSNEIMQAKKPSDKAMAELTRKENEGIVLKAKKQRSDEARVMRNLKAARTAEEVVEQLGSLSTVARNPALWGKWLRRNYTNMAVPALKGYLYSMPTNVVIDVGTEAGIGGLKEIDREVRNMTTFQHGRMREVENITKEWSKLKAPEQKKLAEIMNAATDMQIDPSKDTSNARLNKKWDALTPEAKVVYRKTRDFFRTSYNLYAAYLEQRVKNSGLKDEDKKNIMAALRAMHETGAQLDPYFPLMRHGDYWVRIGKGDDVEFQMFDTPGDRDAYVQEVAGSGMSRDIMISDGTLETGNNIQSLRERVAQQGSEISKIFDSIDAMASGSLDQKSKLKDEIFQLHLLTLPEGSFRKQFIRRKGKAGYSGDALRNFALAGSRMANQLGKVKYGPILNNRIDAARASLAMNPNKDRLDMFVDEMNERVKEQITPRYEEGWWPSFVRAANRFAFVYALTTAKSAITNMFSLPINTVPTMMKYFGIKDTMATVGKFMATLPAQVGVTRVDAAGNVTYTAPSFGSSYMVRRDPELQRAVRDMENMGITLSTQTYDLWLARRGRVSTSKTRQFTEGVVRVTGALFQGSERVIREVAFLSAFKLARRTMSYNDAIMKAVDVVNESLYDYSAWNTPRIMRSNTARLITQFKKYALFTSIYYARNFAQMISPLKGETRRGAAYAFFGSMGLTGLASGVTGMFGVSFTMQMYGVMQSLWNFVFGGDDDETRKKMHELDFVRWFNNVYLPEEFGSIKVAGMDLSELLASGVINTATGYDFASSVSAGNLWFRDIPDSGQWEHALANFVEYMSGPAINITGTMAKGVKDILEGDTKKGLEKLMPIGAIRGPMSSYRMSEEGLVDKDLNVIKNSDDFTTGMLVMQGLGYKTTGVAEVTNMNYYVEKARREIEDKRGTLVRQWVKAVRKGDTDRVQDIQSDIVKFNRMFPIEKLIIGGDDLTNALESKLEKAAVTRKGVEVKEQYLEQEKLRERGLDLLSNE